MYILGHLIDRLWQSTTLAVEESRLRRGRPSSFRRPIRGLAVPSIPSIRTILNTIMA